MNRLKTLISNFMQIVLSIRTQDLAKISEVFEALEAPLVFLTSNSATHHDVPPSSKFLGLCQNWNLRPAVWCCCERENFGPNYLMGEEMHEHAGKDVDDNLYTLCSLSGDKPIILKDSVLPLYPCLSCFDFDSLGTMHPGSVV